MFSVSEAARYFTLNLQMNLVLSQLYLEERKALQTCWKFTDSFKRLHFSALECIPALTSLWLWLQDSQRVCLLGIFVLVHRFLLVFDLE